MPDVQWLLFITQLPATPSSLRVNVWRRLRNSGAASLQNGVWILPRNEENTIFVERLLGYIKQNQASAQIFFVQGINQATHEDILARFEADRDQEYVEFLEQSGEFFTELERETEDRKFTFAELEENEQNLQRLQKWLVKIKKRDFFKAKRSEAAEAAFQDCSQRLHTFIYGVYAQEGMEMPSDADLLPEDDSPSGQEGRDDLEG